MDFKEVQAKIHETSLKRCWWDDPQIDSIELKLAQVHSEVSEAFEELLKIKKGKESSFNLELADIIMRVMDIAGFLKIDLEECILAKDEYNRTRISKLREDEKLGLNKF